MADENLKNEDIEEELTLDIDTDDLGEDLSEETLNKKEKEIKVKITKESEAVKKIDSEIAEVDQELEEDAKASKKAELSDVDETQALIDELKEEKKPVEKVIEEKVEEKKNDEKITTHIFALRTTANREDQVMDFITSHAEKKGFKIYSVIRAHGMRGYIFVEADAKSEAEQAAFNVPYARGILPKEIQYHEIEHMLEQVKKDVNIQQNDIVEIISGPFKRENAKIIRIDKGKEEVVVELLEAAVPIPITLKLDAVKVIRREAYEEKVAELDE